MGFGTARRSGGGGKGVEGRARHLLHNRPKVTHERRLRERRIPLPFRILSPPRERNRPIVSSTTRHGYLAIVVGLIGPTLEDLFLFFLFESNVSSFIEEKCTRE